MIEQELEPQEKVKYLALTSQYYHTSNVTATKDTHNATIDIEERLFRESITDFHGGSRKPNFPKTNGYQRFPSLLS